MVIFVWREKLRVSRDGQAAASEGERESERKQEKARESKRERARERETETETETERVKKMCAPRNRLGAPSQTPSADSERGRRLFRTRTFQICMRE